MQCHFWSHVMCPKISIVAAVGDLYQALLSKLTCTLYRFNVTHNRAKFSRWYYWIQIEKHGYFNIATGEVGDALLNSHFL
jgi:hypothetical protein